MTVTHSQFGTGQIISQDENNVTIDFNGTAKTMVIKYAKLTYEDGTPFGVQAVATEKKKKKSNSQKRIEWESTLTEDQKRELRFEKADGSFDQDAYDKFMDEQEKKKWASKSW